MGQSMSSTAPRKGFKEFVRKFFVSLKRNPQNIAMVMMLVTYLFYSLNLTNIANTTFYINKPNMGQCEFISMLVGILSFVTFLRSFPRREKPKFVMIILTILMQALTVVCDIIYASRISDWLNDKVNPPQIRDTVTGELNDAGRAVFTTQPIVTVHIILLIVTIGLIVLLPVYSKLLKKVNTSINVAGNENMGTIDVDED